MSTGPVTPAPHSAPAVTSFETSQFCQRLQQLATASDDPDLTQLVLATRALLKSAAAISRQVNRFLPQFTLHDDLHLWNVLGFMEELAGGAAGITQLGAGDCAMAVWAAFIHDLGMVVEAGQLDEFDRLDRADAGAATPTAAVSAKRYT